MQTTTHTMHDPYGHTGPAHLKLEYTPAGYMLAALDSYEDGDIKDELGATGDDAGDYYINCYVNCFV